MQSKLRRLALVLCAVATMGLGGDRRHVDIPATTEVLSSWMVPLPPGPAMDLVASKFEVHHRVDGGFEVIVAADRTDELKAIAPGAKLLEADIHAGMRSLDSEWLAGYHTYQTVAEHLQRIATERPELARVETYGQSKEGRDLYALTLTGTTGGNKKHVMITAATHGDELITVEVVMGLLDKLVAGYGSDPRLTSLLDTRVLYFLPVINPDGYVRKSRYANGVDPNREYPWPEMVHRDPNPCIRAVMSFFDGKQLDGSIDYHSSGGMYMFPWSYTQSKVSAEDYRRMDAVTTKMAKTNGYQHGQIPALLYIAKGSSADYYYWKQKSLSIAVEIGNTNVPPSSSIPQHVQSNAEPLWIFLEAV